MAGDETWVFEFKAESKRQTSEWHPPFSPSQKKARTSKSKQKSTLICFFDRHGVIHKKFVPPGKTVNAVLYMNVLTRLRKRIVRVPSPTIGGSIMATPHSVLRSGVSFPAYWGNAASSS
ncbi:HTH_48 domain-containing protein [Trichonephila inaurata madagascariensis]|uniref:HTH_48 domain-containing protein n=1 Tax=Trichonephila inaurata madagascariensis TaxID=2747483 RepID=A0A8X6XSE3_9ARAC|nr:HTH_48 domain-containing protein [Trichonephila inaurata madagascariensis]